VSVRNGGKKVSDRVNLQLSVSPPIDTQPILAFPIGCAAHLARAEALKRRERWNDFFC
jgi:hypothetical protein